MTHPLVDQLYFTRKKWLEGLEDVPAEDAERRIEPMNSISWMIAHLAAHEHRMWVQVAQGENLLPEVSAYGSGQPASTPPLDEAWRMWREATRRADDFLRTLEAPMLESTLEYQGRPIFETTGTALLRLIYHYWYHLGEAQALRQMFGHQDLPSFVGRIPVEGVYRPE